MLNDRAKRRARFWRAQGIVACACLLLAACQTDDNLTTGSIGAAPRTIAFDSIDGPPPPVFQRLVEQIKAQAETRKLPVVSRSDTAAWRVRLYLAAHIEKKQAGISWVGDVYDSRLNRAYRVSGEEALGPVAKGSKKDVWALADNAILARIAASSLNAIMTPGEQTPAPTAEPQDDGPAMSSLPAQTSAFADVGR
jgi:hypothetical protein